MFSYYAQDLIYDVPLNNLTVTGYELEILQNDLELEDDLLGINDKEIHHTFLDIVNNGRFMKN